MPVSNMNHCEPVVLGCLLCTQIRLKSPPLSRNSESSCHHLQSGELRLVHRGAGCLLFSRLVSRRTRAFLFTASVQPASCGKCDQQVLVPRLPVGCMHVHAGGCTLSLTRHEFLTWLIQPARSVLAADALQAGGFPSRRPPKTNHDWANPTAPSELTHLVMVGALFCTKSID